MISLWTGERAQIFELIIFPKSLIMRYALILTTIFLCLSSPGFSQDTRTDTVKAAVGNIREKPGTDAPIIHRVYRGDTLTIYRQEGKWFFV